MSSAPQLTYDGYFIRSILYFQKNIDSFEQIFDKPVQLAQIQEKVSEIYEYLKINNKTELEKLDY